MDFKTNKTRNNKKVVDMRKHVRKREDCGEWTLEGSLLLSEYALYIYETVKEQTKYS